MARILVADDSKTLLELYKSVFMSEGHEVLWASQGDQAIQYAWKYHPDLILLDHAMPGMRGAECARLLKQDPSCQKIPLIIITGRISPKEMEACLQSGADEVVIKPLSLAKLVDILNRYLK